LSLPVSFVVAAAVLSLTGPALGAEADGAVPTYSKQVAPIFYDHCTGCHRPGQIGFAQRLDSYENAKTWASAIREQVLNRSMPPWLADPEHSARFSNDPRLSEQEINTLVAWVDAGTPKGNDAYLAPMPDYPKGWLNPNGRPPDAVVTLPEVAVSATGEIPYIQLRIKVPLAQDKWIKAMQVRPGNAALVHHMGIAEVALADGVKPEDLEKLDALAQQMGMASNSLITTTPAVVDPDDPAVFDMLATYTPGTTFESFGTGNAKLLKGGSNLYINFNIHYTTTGKPEKDKSQLAFWYQDQPPEHQLFRIPAAGKTIIANGRQLFPDDPGTKAEGTDVAIPPIPANAENYELVGITAFPNPVTIFQFQPHAHIRGKDFQYVIVYPDGREETELTVPDFDFHWQLTYDLDAPLQLPAGSKLVVTSHYDNSAHNAHLRGPFSSDMARNCGPDKVAYFKNKNQSWDEMFSPIIQYSIATADKALAAERSQSASGKNSGRVAIQSMTEKSGQHGLATVAAVGCLAQDSSGTWLLTRASVPATTSAQSTTHEELAAMASENLGARQYRILGISAFQPSGFIRQKVAVKGVLIDDTRDPRLNITSLQSVGASCD
jgi:mono/diheme cytochrome c family protein